MEHLSLSATRDELERLTKAQLIDQIEKLTTAWVEQHDELDDEARALDSCVKALDQLIPQRRRDLTDFTVMHHTGRDVPSKIVTVLGYLALRYGLPDRSALLAELEETRQQLEQARGQLSQIQGISGAMGPW